jgi:hypothetical protein
MTTTPTSTACERLAVHVFNPLKSAASIQFAPLQHRRTSHALQHRRDLSQALSTIAESIMSSCESSEDMPRSQPSAVQPSSANNNSNNTSAASSSSDIKVADGIKQHSAVAVQHGADAKSAEPRVVNNVVEPELTTSTDMTTSTSSMSRVTIATPSDVLRHLEDPASWDANQRKKPVMSIPFIAVGAASNAAVRRGENARQSSSGGAAAATTRRSATRPASAGSGVQRAAARFPSSSWGGRAGKPVPERAVSAWSERC